jgi:predicted ABC-type ATPase
MAFVNADEIAKTLPGYPSPGADLQAGRPRIGTDGRTRAAAGGFRRRDDPGQPLARSRIARLRRAGYFFRLIFIWSPSADFSIQRVAVRVRAGGHAIPARHHPSPIRGGDQELFRLYQPLTDRWEVYENTQLEGSVDR